MTDNQLTFEEEIMDTQKGKFLCFQLGKEEYAVEIRYVMEIIGMQRITPLPDLPHFVKGVINLRGKVIPVVDVRLRFGFQERAYDERTCIVVANIQETNVGLIVDSVNEVLDIPDNQIDLPPKVKKGKESRFIQGLGKVEEQVKIILDMERFLFDEELNEIQQSVAVEV
ncbi:MAG: purine-binding chemotaxis protein CheW [Calditrichaeota bacterium]|nr:purine-binding chemotaxis protein CheW [Calditrichota bacterium]